MRTAAVIGTGLIGTSIALALTAKGVTVHLVDREPMAALTAAAVGAGIYEAPAETVDLAILAVPPADVAHTLAEAQKRGLAHAYTDVASVKSRPMREAAALGCDLTSYLGSHPMAGRERSGPLAARADLFEGRSWALTPLPTTSELTRRTVAAMIGLCGARPLVMDHDEHDNAVALISHTPHLVAGLMAARLETAADSEIVMAGQGVRDVTRIAGGDPRLWLSILASNAEPVAEHLTALAHDLETAIAALRGLAAGDAAESDAAADSLLGLLHSARTGHDRLPNKHGAPKAGYVTVSVLVSDRPGELARLFADIEASGVNIEDVSIDHAPGKASGLVELLITPESALALSHSLRARNMTLMGA
ncbi:prephenate dehydrogenase [Streptomyces anulatus]|uniref:prephenate dehydrogenase n=1 Tax=Streptomyces anulatus TaxID=1892 RepID=UPI0036A3A891